MSTKNIIILLVVAVLSAAGGALGYRYLHHGGKCMEGKECHMKEKEGMCKKEGKGCCKMDMKEHAECKEGDSTCKDMKGCHDKDNESEKEPEKK